MGHRGVGWPTVTPYPRSPALSGRDDAGSDSRECVPDPFCIEDDWFVMDIVEFRVHPAASLDPCRKQNVAATIARLGLNDLDWCETRRRHVERYRRHRILHIVEDLFPFVAKEIRRIGL